MRCKRVRRHIITCLIYMLRANRMFSRVNDQALLSISSSGASNDGSRTGVQDAFSHPLFFLAAGFTRIFLIVMAAAHYFFLSPFLACTLFVPYLPWALYIRSKVGSSCGVWSDIPSVDLANFPATKVSMDLWATGRSSTHSFHGMCLSVIERELTSGFKNMMKGRKDFKCSETYNTSSLWE
ncbi:hypothetical protein BC943DRAFT_143394 [Umbelopsis sp. AD052]|nr:hypothetical protein BC943DRAFT_143394 [Umbelopsis sp. AD052]